MLIQAILTQTTQNPVWHNAFFYLFLGSLTLFFTMVLKVMSLLKKKVAEGKLLQQQHAAKIDLIRQEHSISLEKIRIEMLKKEEERNRLWAESEKETLFVLNGISNVFDLTNKIDRVESGEIIKKLDEIRIKIEKITPQD